jgi:putative component of membrane protein insertase Oxa1/YidC/SpoIIIJ protein YidD
MLKIKKQKKVGTNLYRSLSLSMLTKISIITINLYQKYISPHKGFCCAHRAYTGEDSCSQYAKSVIAEYGLISAVPMIREQFDRCAYAAQKMEKEKKEKKKSDSEVLGDCACDLGCSSYDCLSSLPLPRSCSGRSHGSALDSCDSIGDCHPFH